MAEQFQNFFVTKLREACDATATTIYVDTVPAITEGTLVLEYANSTKHEIIHFTGVSGYGLTGCTRGLEGTTAQSHSAGTDVRQNLTAGMIDKIINGVITTENIADGAVTADKIDFTTLTNDLLTYYEKTSPTTISMGTTFGNVDAFSLKKGRYAIIFNVAVHQTENNTRNILWRFHPSSGTNSSENVVQVIGQDRAYWNNHTILGTVNMTSNGTLYIQCRGEIAFTATANSYHCLAIKIG